MKKYSHEYFIKKLKAQADQPIELTVALLGPNARAEAGIIFDEALTR